MAVGVFDCVNGVVVPYLVDNPELCRDRAVRELTLPVAVDSGTYQQHGSGRAKATCNFKHILTVGTRSYSTKIEQ